MCCAGRWTCTPCGIRATSVGDMTWRTSTSVVFTLLSLAAQMFALSAVRAWGLRTQRGAARWLRARWRAMAARLGVSRPATVHAGVASGSFAFAMRASGYAMPQQLADDLAGYVASVRESLDRLYADAQAQRERIALLEEQADGATALAAAYSEDSDLASRWVITGAALAVLALLPQAFA